MNQIANFDPADEPEYSENGTSGDCPRWCDGGHAGAESGDYSSLVHVRSANLQPVVAGETEPFGAMKPYSTQFDVTRYQGSKDREEWVFVGDDASGWCVTVESAARILRALVWVLAGPS